MVIFLCQKPFCYLSRIFKTKEMAVRFKLHYKIQLYLGNCWPCLPVYEGRHLYYSSCLSFSILHITFSPVQTICRGLKSLSNTTPWNSTDTQPNFPLSCGPSQYPKTSSPSPFLHVSIQSLEKYVIQNTQ